MTGEKLAQKHDRDHENEHDWHQQYGSDENDQKRPEPTLKIFSKLFEIEGRKRFRFLIFPSPKAGDKPPHYHDRPDERNKKTDPSEQHVHHPFRALKEISN